MRTVEFVALKLDVYFFIFIINNTKYQSLFMIFERNYKT